MNPNYLNFNKFHDQFISSIPEDSQEFVLEEIKYILNRDDKQDFQLRSENLSCKNLATCYCTQINQINTVDKSHCGFPTNLHNKLHPSELNNPFNQQNQIGLTPQNVKEIPLTNKMSVNKNMESCSSNLNVDEAEIDERIPTIKPQNKKYIKNDSETNNFRSSQNLNSDPHVEENVQNNERKNITQSKTRSEKLLKSSKVKLI